MSADEKPTIPPIVIIKEGEETPKPNTTQTGK